MMKDKLIKGCVLYVWIENGNKRCIIFKSEEDLDKWLEGKNLDEYDYVEDIDCYESEIGTIGEYTIM